MAPTQAVLRPWSNLLFLYQTKTLLPPCRLLRRTIHKSCLKSQPLTTTIDTHLPFEDDHVTDPIPSPSSRSTLTPSERAAFERLESTTRKPRVENPAETDVENDDEEDSSDGYDALSNLFEKVINHQQLRRDKQQRRIDIAQPVPGLRPYWRALSSYGNIERPELFSDRQELYKLGIIRPVQHGELDRTQHHLQVTEKLNGAKSDVDIWEVLESYVFDIVRHVANTVDEYPRIHDRWKVKKNRALQMERLEAETPSDSTPSSGQSTDSLEGDTFGESKSVKSTKGLDILRHNYADLNAQALRLLRLRHPYSPYSLRLLPHIKSMGTISYVLGASTNLYNETCYAQWVQRHDLHGVAESLKEMVNQGLAGDHLTVELLRYLGKRRHLDQSGKSGKIMQEWWQLSSTKEAWSSLEQVQSQLQSERTGDPPSSELDVYD